MVLLALAAVSMSVLLYTYPWLKFELSLHHTGLMLTSVELGRCSIVRPLILVSLIEQLCLGPKICQSQTYLLQHGVKLAITFRKLIRYANIKIIRALVIMLMILCIILFRISWKNVYIMFLNLCMMLKIIPPISQNIQMCRNLILACSKPIVCKNTDNCSVRVIEVNVLLEYIDSVTVLLEYINCIFMKPLKILSKCQHNARIMISNIMLKIIPTYLLHP